MLRYVGAGLWLRRGVLGLAAMVALGLVPGRAVGQAAAQSKDVLVYTDIVSAQGSTVVYFHAPTAKGRYPFLCTFPGHWMVMNGEMLVED